MNQHPHGAQAPVRVLVVDDSVTQRSALIALLNADPELMVIGWAGSGADAVQRTSALKPDVIAMDLRMPGIDGLEATRQILRETPTPIVLITAGGGGAARDQPGLIFQALDAGALAVVSKPAAGAAGSRGALELRQTLKNMARVHVLRRWADDRWRPTHAGIAVVVPSPTVAAQVVAIGASTGGPQAVRDILADLPPDFPPPVLIVQHIAEGFAPGLVAWLASQTVLPVNLAVDGQSLDRPGVWVAPPGRHMGVKGHALALVDGPPVSLHRPSATHLFQSVAREFGSAAIGVLLTGMGDDGAAGLRDLQRAGARTIAQDEASSVVFGMPSAAIRLGVVDYILPPAAIAPILLQRSRT